MFALTLTQPWAALIMLGAKRIETRSWPIKHRGDLLIHAAATYAGCGGLQTFFEICRSEPFRSVLLPYLQERYGRALPEDTLYQMLPLGALLGKVRVVECLKTEYLVNSRYDVTRMAERFPMSAQERAFGDYSAGRYGALLDDVSVFPSPWPARGFQKLWRYLGDLPTGILA